jgi:hypothetical protein
VAEIRLNVVIETQSDIFSVNGDNQRWKKCSIQDTGRKMDVKIVISVIFRENFNEMVPKLAPRKGLIAKM